MKGRALEEATLTINVSWINVLCLILHNMSWAECKGGSIQVPTFIHCELSWNNDDVYLNFTCSDMFRRRKYTFSCYIISVPHFIVQSHNWTVWILIRRNIYFTCSTCTINLSFQNSPKIPFKNFHTIHFKSVESFLFEGTNILHSIQWDGHTSILETVPATVIPFCKLIEFFVIRY